MSISYTAFKKKYPVGSHVCSPEGKYCDQCVSLVRQKMAQVDGVKTGPLGDAVDIPKNATFLKYYEKVSSRKVGDLMFWGDDPGNWTGPYGHAAIYDGGGEMYNQNYNASGRISRDPVFTPGFIGYYRLKNKEDDMLTSRGQAVLHRFYRGDTDNAVPTAAQKKKYLGKVTFDHYEKILVGSATQKKLVAKAKAGTIKPENFMPLAMRKAYKPKK